jgi:hypothetical protein
MGVILGRAVGYLLIGAIAVPLAVLALSILFYVFDSRCGTPGDSGGCEMGIAMNVLMAVPLGAILGCAFGVWRGVKARNLARRAA